MQYQYTHKGIVSHIKSLSSFDLHHHRSIKNQFCGSHDIDRCTSNSINDNIMTLYQAYKRIMVLNPANIFHIHRECMRQMYHLLIKITLRYCYILQNISWETKYKSIKTAYIYHLSTYILYSLEKRWTLANKFLWIRLLNENKYKYKCTCHAYVWKYSRKRLRTVNTLICACARSTCHR